MADWQTQPGKTYSEMAVNLRKAIGASSFPLIGRKTHPQEWRDWYAYYGFRRLISLQELMRERDEKTVPTVSPFDFDGEFNPTRQSPEVPRSKDEGRRPTEQERAIHAARYPGLNPKLRSVSEPAKVA